MKNAVYFFTFSIFLLLNACTSSTNEKQTTNNQRCAQCGMPIEKYQAWKGKIIAKSATKHFCSPRCLFINSQVHGISMADSVFVTDYYQQTLIDGRQAYYVIGSDVIGPMGHDLVPLANRQAAEDFIREHKGEQILTFGEVNAETIQRLSKHYMH